MACKNCGSSKTQKRGKLGAKMRMRLVVAFFIGLCNLVALSLAFLAGLRYAEKKAQKKLPAITPQVLAACTPPQGREEVETTGLGVTSPKLASAEAEWDKDSGVV